jgi:RNA polymerase sigma factor (sigma-70 family)
MTRPRLIPFAQPDRASRRELSSPEESPPLASPTTGSPAQGFSGLAALAEAYLRQRDVLRSFLRRRVRNEQASDDLLNDMWLRISRMANAEAPRDPDAYLRTIAGNLARDWLRRQTLRLSYAAPEADASNLAAPRPTPEQALHSKRALAFLIAVLDELPPRRREALLLYRVEGWPMQDVGRQMGISRRTVEVHVAKAIAYCAARLIEAGFIP